MIDKIAQVEADEKIVRINEVVKAIKACKRALDAGYRDLLQSDLDGAYDAFERALSAAFIAKSITKDGGKYDGQ